MKTKYVLLSSLICMLLAACGSNNSANGLNGLAGVGGVGGVGVGGCMPLTGILSFSTQGASVNDIDILAGTMPQTSTRPGNWGQVVMGAGGVIANAPLVKPGINGTLSLTVTSPSYYPNSGNYNYPGAMATVQGTIQLSQQVLAALQMSTGYMAQPYNNYGYSPFSQGYTVGSITPAYGGAAQYGQAGCISSIGFEAVWVPGYSVAPGAPLTGSIDQVLMYLYMNNGTAPTAIIL